MREIDRKDDQPALGTPIKKPDMPQPYRKVNESGTVRQKPDGMFETLIPPEPTGYGWAFRSKGLSGPRATEAVRRFPRIPCVRVSGLVYQHWRLTRPLPYGPQSIAVAVRSNAHSGADCLPRVSAFHAATQRRF